MRMNSTQERRLGRLLEMRNEILDKIKKAGDATAGTGSANSIEEYLFSLEQGLEPMPIRVPKSMASGLSLPTGTSFRTKRANCERSFSSRVLPTFGTSWKKERFP